MSRLFDPQALLNENTAANDTRRTALPVGETIAQIVELKFDEGISGPNSKRPGTPWYRLNAKLEITDPEYVSQVPGAQEKVTTFLGIMVDMDNGQLAVGPNKNIRLGKFREACGVNGKPLNMLNGQFVRIQIGHKPHPTETDENGQPVIMDEIVGYTKA